MSHNNFLGIRVEGDIIKSGRSNVTQRPIEEFGPILSAALGDARIEAIRWRQYTPYFNDGDACEFGIHDIEVKPVGSDPDAGDYSDGFIDHWSLGYYADKRGDDRMRELKEATADLNKAVAGGEFYDVLLDAFGDHANVTVTTEGITVDFYEHD